jgi:hypothetical protein
MSHISHEVSSLFSESAVASGLVEVLDSILEAVREVGTVMVSCHIFFKIAMLFFIGGDLIVT